MHIVRSSDFQKNQLAKACEGAGIRYEHIPNLGIISEKRKDLKNQSDYDALFDDYEITTLMYARNELNHLLHCSKMIKG